MLPAAARLRHRDDFTRVVRNGRRVGRGALVVHVVGTGIGRSSPAASPSSTEQDPDQHSTSGSGVTSPVRGRSARAGFVVSRAVGPAVTRNLVTRRLRHLLRDRIATLPEGADVVVRALPAAATRPYDALAGDLDSALAKAIARPDRATGSQ